MSYIYLCLIVLKAPVIRRRAPKAVTPRQSDASEFEELFGVIA